MTSAPEFNFTGRRAALLHPSETVRAELRDRLGALGVEASGHWPEWSAPEEPTDFLFVDVDMGHDGLMPWPAGTAPIPTVGLIRSESPGRLGWALEHRFDAFLPQAGLGLVFSSLVIASANCALRRRHAAREAEVARRAGQRHVLVRAVLTIMQRDGVDELAALKRLRAFAMVERVALEDAAALLLKDGDARRESAS